MPAGGFLVFHLYENYTATRGADAYNQMTQRLQELPFAVVLEVLFVLAPLVYHGVYGLFVISNSPPDTIASPYARPWMCVLQRVTGVVLFAFILFHLWTTRLVQLSDHESLDLFRQVQAAIANPWIYAFYVAGILSVTFHLANGIWTFSIVWGLTPGRRAQRWMGWVSVCVFLALTYIGLSGIRAFQLQKL